jgi:hypothetical protein
MELTCTPPQVGLTTEALQHLGADPLVCANTLLYGTSLIRDHPVSDNSNKN